MSSRAHALAWSALVAVRALCGTAADAQVSTASAEGSAPVRAERRADLRADSLAVLAVADSALARITRRDFVGFTDLMTPDAVIGAVSERGARAGYRSRSREQERAANLTGTIVERGFAASAMVSGPVAMVWVPYDLYRDGKWSHCGVDIFTFVRTGGSWRIATLVYSVDQPPACLAHPDGPPR